MLITVSDIPITGKHYSFDFQPDGIEEIKDVQYLEPIHFEGDIYKSKSDVRISARVTTKISTECSRCLEPLEYPIDANFDVFYRPYPTQAAKEEEIPFGELGTLYYRDNQIDLAEATRDTIILEIPMKLLCKEECKGLCHKCGKNKNQEECECKEEKPSNNPFVEFFKEHPNP